VPPRSAFIPGGAHESIDFNVMALRSGTANSAEDDRPMLGESHDLLHEFPDLETKIANLRGSNEEFAHLMDQYDTLDARVRRLEELGTPVADETIEDLKKQRLMLKDRLYELLRS
jgi:uncharacterized protein YdcH (DUF465 family)